MTQEEFQKMSLDFQKYRLQTNEEIRKLKVPSHLVNNVKFSVPM